MPCKDTAFSKRGLSLKVRFNNEYRTSYPRPQNSLEPPRLTTVFTAIFERSDFHFTVFSISLEMQIYASFIHGHHPS